MVTDKHDFLIEVQRIIGKAGPSKAALLALLQLGTPTLTESNVIDERTREKALKRLSSLIHPDKNIGMEKLSTEIFQDLPDFFDNCVESLVAHKRSKRTNIPTSPPSRFPPSFHVQQKWPFLSNENIMPRATTNVQDCDLAALVNAQSVNTRGAIAHGQMTELHAGIDDVRRYVGVLAFCSENGGAKWPYTVEQIKHEIMTCGPLITASFCNAC